MTEGPLKSCFHPRWVLLTLIAVGCVLGLTHIPGQNIPRALQDVAPDKVEHIVAYALIAGSFLLSLKRPVRPPLLLIGLMTLAGIAALDEMTQPLVGRACDLWDFASDLVGMAIPCMVSGIARLLRFHAVPS